MKIVASRCTMTHWTYSLLDNHIVSHFRLTRSMTPVVILFARRTNTKRCHLEYKSKLSFTLHMDAPTGRSQQANDNAVKIRQYTCH